MKKINVIIADDHKLFRKGLYMILSDVKEISKIREAQTGKEVIALMKKRVADVILMDLNMPVMNGFDASSYIIKKYPETKVIVLTMHDDETYISHLLEIGVHGYVLKNADPEEIESSVINVYEKDFYYNNLVSRILHKGFIGKIVGKPKFPSKIVLTTRETEVLRFVCKELTNGEIADKLLVTRRTVEKVRSNLLRKVHARNTVGLVKYALKHNVFSN